MQSTVATDPFSNVLFSLGTHPQIGMLTNRAKSSLLELKNTICTLVCSFQFSSLADRFAFLKLL